MLFFCETIRKTTKRYPDGTPQEMVYYSGNKEIAKQTFYEKGNKILVGKIPDGLAKEYNENGQIQAEESFKDGQLNGLVKAYNKKGKLDAELNYENGKLSGLAKGYYQKGKLKEEQNYKDGKRDGVAKIYFKNGKLQSKIIFKDGVEVSRKKY